jgi:RHS repeat-associated protein
VATSTGLFHTDASEPTSLAHFNSKNQLRTSPGVYNYDAVGNQLTYGAFTLAYDAENRNTTVTSTGSGSGSYSYDGDGRRVKKVWTPAGGTAVTTYYAYDALGQLAAEYSTQAPTSTGTSYIFSDMLGSVRTITSSSKIVTECYDYLPFGRMLSSSDNGRSSVGSIVNGTFQSCYPAAPDTPDTQLTSGTEQKFTGKERDAETGLDYFLARYYSGAQGRFLSVDPGNAGAKTEDPQSWNAYAYSRNNPLRYVDPDGRLYEVVWDQEGFHETWLTSDSFWESYEKRYRNLYEFSGGIIYYRPTKKQVGTYRHIIDDRILAIKLAGEMATPTAEYLTADMRMFGYIAAPGAMALADYISGEDRSKTNLVLAAIPFLPFKSAGLSARVERVLADIAAGTQNFKKDGTLFRNIEGLLPTKPLGYYKEFTVAEPGATYRGAERLVVGGEGEIYFSPDHYRSFARIQ